MRQQKPDTHAAEYAAPEGIISRANQRSLLCLLQQEL
jgi:hypothetical protein